MARPLLMLLLLAPAAARAQGFYLPEAGLRAADAGVGQVVGLRVSALEWRGPREAALRFEDARLTLSASVDLAAEGTYLAARARTCSKGDCRSEPPLPSGPAQWIVPFEGGPAPHFILQAWVQTPAEQLADDPKNLGGFGLCSSPPEGWPRRP